MLGEKVEKYHDTFYVVLRVVAGLLFFLHGAQKILGWFGGIDGQGATVPLMTLIGAAGAIELVAGPLIAVGLFTRWAAGISALEMAYAYFLVHAKQGWNPILNKGEPALLFLIIFLIILAHGGHKWYLEEKLFKKEM